MMAGALGAGTLVSEDQLGYLNYVGVGAGFSLTGSYRLWGPIEVDGRAAIAAFVSEDPTGTVIELGIGPRLTFALPGTAIELGPAAHVNLAQTGEDTRPSVDISLRALFPVGEEWVMGPELLVDRVFQTSAAFDVSTDADFWLLSAVLAYAPRVEPDPPAAAEHTLPPPRRITVLTKAPPRDVPPAPPSPELSVLLDEVVTTRVETRLLAPALFEFDSTRLTSCGEAALHYARDVISHMGDHIVIEGHADGTGTDDYNRDLSRRRAEFVHEWMVRQGVPAEHLQVEAQGEQQLLVKETDEAQMQLNRRVTFRVVEEAAP